MRDMVQVIGGGGGGGGVRPHAEEMWLPVGKVQYECMFTD